jgi:hypothetical protein
MISHGRAHQMRVVMAALGILTLVLLAGCKPVNRGFVAGQIVDESGSPVEGAQIVVRDLSADDDLNDTESYSAADGGFHVPVRCECGGLSVYAEGYASLYCDRKIVQGANSGWTIKLTRLVSVSGTVLDTEGRPVPDRVLVFKPLRTPTSDGSEIGYYMNCCRKEDCTDAQGRFHLSDIPPLKCEITVSHVGDHLRQQPVNSEVFDLTRPENRADLEIRIYPPGDYAISGHIHDAQGHPVPRVFVDTHSIPHGLHWYTFSDEKGVFRLEGLDGLGKDPIDVHFRGATQTSGGFQFTKTTIALHTTDLKVVVP